MAGNIQRFEVMVVIFDFRAGLNVVTDTRKECFDTLHGAGHRVQSTHLFTTTWQCDINGLAGQLGVLVQRFPAVLFAR